MNHFISKIIITIILKCIRLFAHWILWTQHLGQDEELSLFSEREQPPFKI